MGERTAGELVLRGGTILDESGERRGDVAVRDGRVAEVGGTLRGERELDAAGCVVAPGLVDLHTHLREPGTEEAETVASGARAAARGGYTAVVAMPNTVPPADSTSVVAHVRELGRDAPCAVHPAGTVTLGRAGEALAPLGGMHAGGVRVFTDDGDCVADALVMRRALEYASSLPGAVVAQHAEDPSLVRGGAMHEGRWSSRLGVPGRPAAAEAVIVARDLELCRLTGARLHLLHLSTAAAVGMVRAAKAEGLPVTAEATPHHLVLTDEACGGYDPRFKVNPPLRDADDVEAVRAGLADGTIDAVATDHAPHPPEAKEEPFAEALPGMPGLETALGVVFNELVRPGVLDLPTALARMSWAPARIAGLAEHGRPVAAGELANLCVVDPEATWEVEAALPVSRARNTPWAGRKLTGRVRHTILRGEPVVVDGEVIR